MPDLIYVANSRLPTEKAHGLQIVQMCEAFAQAGYTVTLVTPRRRNTPEMHAVGSLWDYYGVERNFAFHRLICLDLLSLPIPRLPFLVQTFTYLLVLWFWLLRRSADVIYTRDLFAALLITLTRPRVRLGYEAHQVHGSRLGRWAQGIIVRRAAVVTITAHLGEKLRDLGADHVQVAHDGIRAARFATLPDQAAARDALGWSHDQFVVGWVGRLHLMGVDKGVGILVEALRQFDGAALALVGGPENMVAALRAQWIAAGLDSSHFLAAGQVLPDRVPQVMSAFDVCVMPHPWTEHFAYYTSPIKLFEYMASGRPVVVSDLPGFAEVVTDGESALMVPPGDVAALAGAIRRLHDDRPLGERLAARARRIVLEQYTWQARAQAIRAHLEHRKS